MTSQPGQPVSDKATYCCDQYECRIGRNGGNWPQEQPAGIRRLCRVILPRWKLTTVRKRLISRQAVAALVAEVYTTALFAVRQQRPDQTLDSGFRIQVALLPSFGQ